MPDNKTPKYQYDHYDFGDMLDSAVEAGSKIGSSVLGSIADALAQAGGAMSRPQPDSFAAWKRRLERKWKNGGQTVGIALTAVGWTFTGCFGITALVMGILTAVAVPKYFDLQEEARMNAASAAIAEAQSRINATFAQKVLTGASCLEAIGSINASIDSIADGPDKTFGEFQLVFGNLPTDGSTVDVSVKMGGVALLNLLHC